MMGVKGKEEGRGEGTGRLGGVSEAGLIMGGAGHGIWLHAC
jgi:hypothetical protein